MQKLLHRTLLELSPFCLKFKQIQTVQTAILEQIGIEHFYRRIRTLMCVFLPDGLATMRNGHVEIISP